jgi:SAM-dependent methyltransferase
MTISELPREFGRQAFGGDPVNYDRARPGYPEWVYNTLCSRCGLGPNCSTFEIGAGTGTATRRLLELGANPLTAVEPDRRLADFLRKTTGSGALNVVAVPFEDVALEKKTFDLGVSATAFHWLDEDATLLKIASLLRPGGWWAAIWNVFGDESRPDPFHEATNELLQGIYSPAAAKKRIPFGLDAEARMAALRRVGAFDLVETKTSQWSLVLDANQTVELYATYSNVNARVDREEVLAELGRIARDEFKGRVTRNMTTSLYIARRAR